MRLLEKKYSVKKLFFTNNELVHCYYLIESNTVKNQRKLALLHGAGVAGVDTWTGIVSLLDNWQSILVPDLRGMGETFHQSLQEEAFSVIDLVDDLHQLVTKLDWPQFDLAGYSLGGLVAMLFKQQYPQRVEQQFVLEPGLLDRLQWSDSQAIRDKYAQAVKYLRHHDAQQGVVQFLNTISPHRKNVPVAENLAIKRLMQRHLGFANALECVNNAAKHIDRDQLVADQGHIISIIGGLSVDSMHQYHQQLADQHAHWHYENVLGTDHSLPYQKPRQIARLFNQA